MSSPAATVEKAIRDVTAFVRARLLEPEPAERRPIEFKLRHAGPSSSRRIVTAKVRDAEAGAQADAIARSFVQEAKTWVEGLEAAAADLPQRFLVVSISKQGSGDTCSFNLRNRSTALARRGDVTLSEPPTLLGQLQMQMRHNEIDARTHSEGIGALVDGIATLFEAQNQMVKAVAADNQTLRRIVDESLQAREELATARHAREFEIKKLEGDSARRDKMTQEVVRTVIPKAAGYAFQALEKWIPALKPPALEGGAAPAAAPRRPEEATAPPVAPPGKQNAGKAPPATSKPAKGSKGAKGKAPKAEKVPDAPWKPPPAAPAEPSADAIKADVRALVASLPDALQLQIVGALKPDQVARFSALLGDDD